MNPYRERQNLQAPGQFGQTTGGYHPGTIVVRNTTASEVPAYGILQLKQPAFTVSDDDDATFAVSNIWDGEATDPDASTLNCGFGRFCVTTHSIVAGGIGIAIVEGMAHVKINKDIGDWRRADIGASSACLYTHPFGSARILWIADSADGDGLYNAKVKLCPGNLDGAISGSANGASSLVANVSSRNPTMSQCTANLPVGADDVPYVNTMADISDGANIVIHWEYERNRAVLGPATCTGA